MSRRFFNADVIGTKAPPTADPARASAAAPIPMASVAARLRQAVDPVSGVPLWDDGCAVMEIVGHGISS